MNFQLSPDLAVSAGIRPDCFPQTKEDAKKLEVELLEEFDKLSMSEQEMILFDLHGLPSSEEKPCQELVASRLKRLEVLLDSFPGNGAYKATKEIDPKFVQGLLPIFLESENYDLELTAEKLVQHLDVKRRLFGSGEILGRDVRQSDLTPKDIENLQMGFMQFAPVSDSSGRVMLYIKSIYEPGRLDADAMVSSHNFCLHKI